MAKSFGRDEMNALIGGGTEEVAAFRSSTMPLPNHRKSRNSITDPKEKVDFSKLTAAETAAILMRHGTKEGKQHQQSVMTNASRYRAKSDKKKLAHHELLEELTKQRREDEAQRQNRESQTNRSKQESDEEDEEEFVKKRQRSKAAVIIRRREEGVDGSSRGRRRSSYSSSSVDSDSDSNTRKRAKKSLDSSDEDNRRQRRRRRDDSSGSDDEDDSRRRRVVAARLKAQQETVVVPLKDAKEKNPHVKRSESVSESATKSPVPPKAQIQAKPASKNHASAQVGRGDMSISSSGSSSHGSSGSNSDSDSSEEEEPIMTKAIFVPKHKRNLIKSNESKWEEEERKAQLRMEQEQKRKMESRALVAKQLAEAESSMVQEEDDDEAGGATNAMLDDDDEIDPQKERNAWELRELNRLLKTMDEAMNRQQQEEEYQRRRNMTDAECLQEDIKMGRYQAPGANRRTKAPSDKGKIVQRFYHRGAYYMDESEWGENDVREKAAEYAKAATGEDKIDKSKLPEVMKVKGFGRANQNHKYKGLAREDTTDKSARILPLVHGKSKTK